MRFPARTLSILLLAPYWATPLHSQKLESPPAPISQGFDVEASVLSDTRGATLDPYMKRVIGDLRAHWMKQLAQSTGQNSATVDTPTLDLTIAPDGHLTALHLQPSGNTTLDKAARESAKSTQYPVLPFAMKNAPLRIQVSFHPN